MIEIPPNIRHQRETAVLFGENVRDRRKLLGITQQQLADHLGWDRVKLSEVENGKQRVHLDDALWIGRQLGIDDLEAICGAIRIG